MKLPVVYSEKIADELCRRLANGETLRQICKGPGFPAEASIREWALDPNHPISSRYVRARELGFLKMADELLEISDDSSNDLVVDANGNTKVDHENINRARLMVDTRKWLLSKALPKIFGDKIQVGGDPTNNTPIVLSWLTEAEARGRGWA